MINKLPAWSQPTVKQYLETGQFKDHKPVPMDPNEAAEGKEMMQGMIDAYVAQDNTSADSNPAKGVIETQEDFFGSVRAEYQNENGIKEGFATVAGREGSVVYIRNTEKALDVLVVSNEQGADDGVFHFSHSDPNGSFMTMDFDRMLIAH